MSLRRAASDRATNELAGVQHQWLPLVSAHQHRNILSRWSSPCRNRAFRSQRWRLVAWTFRQKHMMSCMMVATVGIVSIGATWVVVTCLTILRTRRWSVVETRRSEQQRLWSALHNHVAPRGGFAAHMASSSDLWMSLLAMSSAIVRKVGFAFNDCNTTELVLPFQHRSHVTLLAQHWQHAEHGHCISWGTRACRMTWRCSAVGTLTTVRRRRRASFNREITILFSLEHPHLVRRCEWFEAKDHLWIALELWHGGELYALLAECMHESHATLNAHFGW